MNVHWRLILPIRATDQTKEVALNNLQPNFRPLPLYFWLLDQQKEEPGQDDDPEVSPSDRGTVHCGPAGRQGGWVKKLHKQLEYSWTHVGSAWP